MSFQQNGVLEIECFWILEQKVLIEMDWPLRSSRQCSSQLAPKKIRLNFLSHITPLYFIIGVRQRSWLSALMLIDVERLKTKIIPTNHTAIPVMLQRAWHKFDIEQTFFGIPGFL